MCSRRLFQLHSRLKKDEPLLREYDQTIRQQIESKIVEECEESQDPEDCSHFLPHHGVIKQDRQTTKLRVVFDGSAKSSNDDLSLNDCLQKGPNLVPHLFDTVIKFRGYPIGIIADIEKAFHQIQIAPDDRRMLKFLWLDDIEKGTPEVKQYQFRRLPFGLTPSPAILASTIRYHLSKYEESEPKIVSLLRDSFYVDDFASGAYEVSEALQIYRTSKELMNKGGFQLRKWNSNSKPVRESIKVQEGSPANEMNQIKQEVDYCDSDGIMQVNADTSNEKDSVTSPSQPPSVESDEDCFVKFLGINWNVNTDEFRYDLTELMSYANSLPDTKRSVLKLAAKVFDPMGLLTPFTINMAWLGRQIRRQGFNEMALTRSWSSRFEWRQSTPLLLQTHRWATQELPDSRILWCVRQRLCRSRLSSNRTLHWRSRSQPYGIQDPSRSNQETDHASTRVDGSKPTGKINRRHSMSLHVAKGYSWGYTVDRFVINIVLDQEQQGLETVRPTSSQWDTRTDEQAPMEAFPWGVKPRRLALSRMFRSRAQEKWNLVDRTSFSEISRRAMANRSTAH